MPRCWLQSSRGWHRSFEPAETWCAAMPAWRSSSCR